MSDTAKRTPARTRQRVGLIYLASTFFFVGLWGTLGTRSFFDGFPGGGHHWVAGDGPYNAHLVSDTAVGFLAVAVVLTLAAAWMERRVMQAALAAAVVHTALHLLFHLRRPSDELPAIDRLLSNGGLALGGLLALVLLVVVSRGGVPVPSEGPSGVSPPSVRV